MAEVPMSFVLIVQTEQRKCDVDVMRYRKKPSERLSIMVYKIPSGILIGEKSE